MCQNQVVSIFFYHYLYCTDFTICYDCYGYCFLCLILLICFIWILWLWTTFIREINLNHLHNVPQLYDILRHHNIKVSLFQCILIEMGRSDIEYRKRILGAMNIGINKIIINDNTVVWCKSSLWLYVICDERLLTNREVAAHCLNMLIFQ